MWTTEHLIRTSGHPMWIRGHRVASAGDLHRSQGTPLRTSEQRDRPCCLPLAIERERDRPSGRLITPAGRSIRLQDSPFATPGHPLRTGRHQILISSRPFSTLGTFTAR